MATFTRTVLEASFSERFYGDSYGLNLSHQNKRLTNTISYVEDIQTFTRNNFVRNIIGFYFCPDNITQLGQCIIGNDSTVFPDDPNNPDDQGFQIFPIQNFTLVEDNVFSLNKTLAWTSILALPRTNITFNANQTKT